MLNHLKLEYVGPAKEMELDFAPRLNILTGDNGLGKTFILDVAWWALTRTWATQPAWPQPGKAKEAHIAYSLDAKSKRTNEIHAKYVVQKEDWSLSQGRPGMAGLVLYVRVDGGFSVWDPARNYWKKLSAREYEEPDRPSAFNFSTKEVWDGMQKNGGQWLCNGLLRDWVSWQDRKSDEFRLLYKVLKGLSAGENEVLKPGKHMRVSVNDTRDIPTINLPYGTVPVTLASAGIRRVLALAYLIVWAHTEHQTAAELIGDKPTDRFVILIDEVESHLHPQWQRVLLPALQKVIDELGSGGAVQHGKIYPQIQVIASTHAPLVMASIESRFYADLDKVFNFDTKNGDVHVEEVPWAKQGDVIGWLVSEVFGLRQARSKEAEEAIEAAEAYMRGDTASLPDNLNTKEKIHTVLKEVLPGHDPFWPRWIVKTEAEQ